MFDDLEDDEFDFHGYCIRKSTLKAYLKCVPSKKETHHSPPSSSSADFENASAGSRLHKYEGDLRSQENYVKAALAAAKVRLLAPYLSPSAVFLLDRPADMGFSLQSKRTDLRSARGRPRAGWTVGQSRVQRQYVLPFLILHVSLIL